MIRMAKRRGMRETVRDRGISARIEAKGKGEEAEEGARGRRRTVKVP